MQCVVVLYQSDVSSLDGWGAALLCMLCAPSPLVKGKQVGLDEQGKCFIPYTVLQHVGRNRTRHFECFWVRRWTHGSGRRLFATMLV